MTITVKKTHTEEREVNIPIPCFWKKINAVGVEYVGILDKKTAASVSRLNDNYLSLTNSTPELLTLYITRAQECFDLCSEEEFLREYQEALDQLPLRPQLTDTEGERELDRKAITGSY